MSTPIGVIEAKQEGELSAIECSHLAQIVARMIFAQLPPSVMEKVASPETPKNGAKQ